MALVKSEEVLWLQMTEPYCPACTLMRAAARAKHKCCLTCRFSYFRPLEEDGMCWNPDLAMGIHPKAVQEFLVCPRWQKKD